LKESIKNRDETPIMKLKMNEKQELWQPVVEEDHLSDGRPVFYAYVPEVLGIAGSGETPDDAVNQFHECMEHYVSALIADGIVPPRPNKVLLTVRIDDDFENRKPQPKVEIREMIAS
jgi:predicted RNase H-like HicB family nuclease